jgi:hypothetical protein
MSRRTEHPRKLMNQTMAEFVGTKDLGDHIEIAGRAWALNKRFYPYSLQYHKSWDWLMPVWEKAGKWIYEHRGEWSSEHYLTAHNITKQFLTACQTADVSAAHYAVYLAVNFINDRTRERRPGDEAHLQ